jgi:cell wall-associated NlpC family hydrolase
MFGLNSYIGIPFKELGRDRKGLDCYGLVRLFYAEQFDTTLPILLDNYASTKDGKEVSQVVNDCIPEWSDVKIGSYGDCCLFNLKGLPIHLGVYIGDGFFLHAIRGADSCIERLDSKLWEKRFKGFYRYGEA